MKKLVGIFLSIILPSVFVQLYWDSWSDISAIGASIILYMVTIIGLLFFYRFRPCRMWILLFGFALPIPISYIGDYLNNSEYLTYVQTGLTTAYYSIPFIIISLTAAIISTIRKK